MLLKAFGLFVELRAGLLDGDCGRLVVGTGALGGSFSPFELGAGGSSRALEVAKLLGDPCLAFAGGFQLGARPVDRRLPRRLLPLGLLPFGSVLVGTLPSRPCFRWGRDGACVDRR